MEIQAAELRERQLAHARSRLEVLCVKCPDPGAEDDDVHGNCMLQDPLTEALKAWHPVAFEVCRYQHVVGTSDQQAARHEPDIAGIPLSSRLSPRKK